MRENAELEDARGKEDAKQNGMEHLEMGTVCLCEVRERRREREVERCEAVGRAEEDAKHTMNKCNNNNLQCSVNAT